MTTFTSKDKGSHIVHDDSQIEEVQLLTQETCPHTHTHTPYNGGHTHTTMIKRNN